MPLFSNCAYNLPSVMPPSRPYNSRSPRCLNKWPNYWLKWPGCPRTPRILPSHRPVTLSNHRHRLFRRAKSGPSAARKAIHAMSVSLLLPHRSTGWWIIAWTAARTAAAWYVRWTYHHVNSSRWRYQRFRFKSWNIAGMGAFARTAKKSITHRCRRKFRSAAWSAHVSPRGSHTSRGRAIVRSPRSASSAGMYCTCRFHGANWPR